MTYRQRFCNGGKPGQIGCMGESQELTSTYTTGEQTWSSWSECSNTCGENGLSYRFDGADNFESRPCRLEKADVNTMRYETSGAI